VPGLGDLFAWSRERGGLWRGLRRERSELERLAEDFRDERQGAVRAMGPDGQQ
jgi:hypothetical protein